MKSLVAKKWIILTVSVLVVVVTIAIILTLVLTGREANKDYAENPQTQPAKARAVTEHIDWDEVLAVPEPKLGFVTSVSSANIPVKGTLQVQIDPNDIAKIPQAINVYQILPCISSEADLRERAKRFGIEGKLNEPYASIQKGDKKVYYSWGEDAIYFRNLELEKYPKKIPDVPSEKKCKEIAWGMAKRYGLLVPDAKIIGMSGTGGTVGGVKLHTFTREVVIGCSIDGYEVRGPGMQLMLCIGDKGQLVSMFDNLRETKLYGTYRMKPIAQALDEAQRGDGTLNQEPETENPTVTNVSIVYFAESTEREQRLLQPVYAFMSGDCCIYVTAYGEPISN